MGFLLGGWRRALGYNSGMAGCWRQVILAAAVSFVPLLFDIAGYLKGYAGGLVVYTIERLAYRPGRGNPMIQVSASLFVGFTRVGTMNGSIPATWRG